MIKYGKQDISKQDIEAVCEVLKSEFLTQGPAVPLFEDAVKSYCNVSHAVATNSATSALHIALMALGVGKNDLVWTSPNSFVASANCALYCGAEIDFVDIDPVTYNLCVDALSKKLEQARAKDKLPKVLVPVHFSGMPCKMEEIYDLSIEYGFRVVEDASHAIGASYPSGRVGNCKYSDITIFSFHPVKIITTAEGGIALTNNDSLYDKMALLRSHGITREHQKLSVADPAPWYYEQLTLGYNYRMTDIQAALGTSQMQRLDDFINARARIAKIYSEELSALPLILPKDCEGYVSSWHLYVARTISEGDFSVNHREVFEKLRQKRIGVNLHYIPIHTQPYYQEIGFRWGDFPNAEKYSAEALSIPIYPSLTDEEIKEVVDAFHEVLN